MADENERSFGPYELRPGVNSLMFGADPVVTLQPGKSFSTPERGIAAFLDEHPAVRRGKAKPKSKPKSKPKPARKAPRAASAASSGSEGVA